MGLAAYVAIGASIATAAVGAGALFWRATNAQLQANAKLAAAQAMAALAQADKTNEERRGVDLDNRKDLIALTESVMEKQNLRFEAEVGRMKVAAEQMGLASLKDSETIAQLRVLIEEERAAHRAAMDEERRRCDRALEELHLRIDELSKRIQLNTTSIAHLDVGGSSLLDTPVIITPAPPEETS